MTDHLPVPVELTDRELDAVAAGAVIGGAAAGGLVAVAVNVGPVDVDVSRVLSDNTDFADVAINVLGVQRGNQ
jgi:hypothetical protein